MLNYQPSIRKKITLGYYAIVAIIAALSLFTFMELRFMEEKIRFREIISEFFDAILEIRRFEKTIFFTARDQITWKILNIRTRQRSCLQAISRISNQLQHPVK